MAGRGERPCGGRQQRAPTQPRRAGRCRGPRGAQRAVGPAPRALCAAAPAAVSAAVAAAEAAAARGAPRAAGRAAAAARPGALGDFERLWTGVAIDHASAAPPAERDEEADPAGQEAKYVCQFGLSNETFEVARFLLGRLRPPLDALEVDDAGPGSGAAGHAAHLLAQLQAEFGARVRAGAGNFVRPGNPAVGPLPRAAGPACDAVVYSEAAPRFALERVLGRLRRHVVVALVSHSCIQDEVAIPQPWCNMVNVIWEKTSLLRFGFCVGAVCMARVPARTLRDPNTLPLACGGLGEPDGSRSTVAEFGQDWFLSWNFFRRASAERERVYVDVGASLPFEYSNTVMLDRCLGWRGICIEPNPHIVSFLEAHRSCEVVRRCVADEPARGKPFSDRQGEVMFHAHCSPLGEILFRAGLRGRRIDVLSVDVEHGELGVLRGFSFGDFDIRFITIEVTQGVRWLEVDTAILPHGFAKVAVLGRDVVYAKLGELSGGAFAEWAFLHGRGDGGVGGASAALPANWAHFHGRLVEEEREAEALAERDARARGLRRA